jgi:hypothetical protein
MLRQVAFLQFGISILLLKVSLSILLYHSLEQYL